MQARLRSESTVSLYPKLVLPARFVGSGSLLTGSPCVCVCVVSLRFRKDRQARGQGRASERGCRAGRRQRPLHHHGLHGTRLDLLRLFRAT